MLLNRSPGTKPSTTLRNNLLLAGLLVLTGAAAACSAGDTGEEESCEDNDGDAVLDCLGSTIDADGDGVADEYDIDGDGEPDGTGVDTDNDGQLDAIGYDTDGDGVIDALDTTGDGIPDQQAPGGDGDGDGDGDIMIGDGDGDIMIGDGDGMGVEGNFCDSEELIFEPQTPTVYVVVDRSTSMFETGMYWVNLRDSLLPVLEGLQADVRFGFASYTGEKGNDATCGLDAGVAIGQNNFADISTAYNALGQPVVKGETPTSFAIQQATERLLADESPGGRFILLVSDGSPDMCGDDYNDCGIDGTVAALQIAANQGIRTLVFGIETQTVDQAQFDRFAQAGNGEAPSGITNQGGQDITTYDEYSGFTSNICPGRGIWDSLKTENAAFRTESGMVASDFQPAGAYSAEGGTATAFLSTDIDALAAQISSSLAGLKSCTFEFNFDVEDESAGEIYVGDKETPIPADQWQMTATNILELTGSACDTWQSKDVNYFFAGFPCEAIVVR